MGESYRNKNTTRIEVRGVSELGNRLIKLDQRVRRQVARDAIEAGCQVFLGPLRAATPVSKHKSKGARPSGTTRESTTAIIRTYKGGQIQAAFIGHEYPDGAAAHLSEEGTAERRTVAGHNRGRVVGRHWFRAVYAVYARPMQAAVRDKLASGIEEAAKQIGGAQ